MKYIVLALLILILPVFSSCSVVTSLLGYKKCAYPGCDREALENCNYCVFHCDTNYVPEDFDAKMGKSINDQLKDGRKLLESNQ